MIFSTNVSAIVVVRVGESHRRSLVAGIHVNHCYDYDDGLSYMDPFVLSPFVEQSFSVFVRQRL